MKRIIFKLEPKKGYSGVPINQLQKILLAFQKALWKMGEFSMVGNLTRERGKIPEIVLGDYTLEIISFDSGSLVVNAQLHQKEQVSFLSTPEDDLDKLIEVVRNIPDNRQKVTELIPDNFLRRKVLYNLKELSQPQNVKSVLINDIPVYPDFREYIDDFLIKTTTEEEKLVVGPIIELRLIDPMYFGILSQNRIEKIPLSEDITEDVISNVAKVVLIRCLSEKDVDTGKHKIKEIINVNPLESNTFEIDAIEYKCKRLLFSKTIYIRIKLEDELWILENDKLEITAFGEDFSSAWDSFREDLIYMWDEIGREKIGKLDSKAKKLRELLNNLIIEELSND